eukprot:772832-Amphidinium_carterae.1
MRVDDGFISADAPFECVPRDIEYPHDRRGIWEEKVNELPLSLLMTPCWYHHHFMIIKMLWEEEVKKENNPRRVRFAPELEDTAPHRS